MADQDTGLGLGQFLKKEASPESGLEKPPVEEKGAEEEEADPQEERASEESAEEEVEEEKASENSEDSSEPDPSVKTPEEKLGLKVEKKEQEKSPEKEQPDKPVKEEAKPSKEAEEINTLRKRFHDTRNWANNLNQTNQKLQQQLDREKKQFEKQIEILNKKIDGTYDPERDFIPQATEPEVNPELERFQAETAGRAQASRQAAVKEFGTEEVDGFLMEFQEIFGSDPLVQQRVIMSDMPVYEAINAVKGYKFFSEYGNDPIEIETKIRQKVLDEEIPKLRETITKELMEKLTKKQSGEVGLAKAKGIATVKKSPSKGPKPLGDILSG